MADNIAVLDAGSVEYDIEEAAVSIDDLITALEEAKEEGIERVVLSSGNHRGAKWQRLLASWEWADE